MSTCHNEHRLLPDLPEDVIDMILSYLPVKDKNYDQCMEHLLYKCGKWLCCWAENGGDFCVRDLRDINRKGMSVLRARFGWWKWKKPNAEQLVEVWAQQWRQSELREKIRRIQQDTAMSEKEKTNAVQALYYS